jgi:hypothetical protein
MADHLFKDLKNDKAPRFTPTQEKETPSPAPHDFEHTGLMNLQRMIGNQAVQRVLAQNRTETPSRQPSLFIQAKLTVGAADDQYEQEADSVASQVMTMRDPAIQREGDDEEMALKRADIRRQESGEAEEEELAQTKRIQREGDDEEMALKRADIRRQESGEAEEEELAQTKRIQREGDDEEMALKRADIQREGDDEEMALKRADIQREGDDEEMALKRADIQRANTNMEDSFEVGSGVESSIQSQKGGGQALPDSSRGFFESRFGYDFGNVRVHTGSESDTLNRSLNAKAFTTGSDIFFRSGDYNPGSGSGQELLAHELTHVVQQGGANVKKETDER